MFACYFDNFVCRNCKSRLGKNVEEDAKTKKTSETSTQQQALTKQLYSIEEPSTTKEYRTVNNETELDWTPSAAVAVPSLGFDIHQPRQAHPHRASSSVDMPGFGKKEKGSKKVDWHKPQIPSRPSKSDTAAAAQSTSQASVHTIPPNFTF